MEKDNINITIKEAVEISIELNKILEYYNKLTLNIKDLLNEVYIEENIGNIEEIQENLNKRDILIAKYNKLKLDYDALNSIVNLSEIKKLKELEQLRLRILHSIEEIDTANTDKTNELFIKQQFEIKKINEGKRMHNAYEGKHPMAYGVFIDKKK